ncbi:hypothetical protein ECEPECA14_2398 [Escherichia coli EPECa14]|nr:Putative inner membrane protein [Escherichia coli]EFZ41852.1 hypothetical protein ECEPECA14_2398 [Escherichia coli EPECa14]EHW23301.1 hypothetical protein ECDEC8C_1162 [Escherichia coli DEC8C]EHW29375.1 hypothetical protein ECDEC8D_1249 [Escherichia coli DEC8D]EHW66739.1 hypothetical protein ECDEC10A_1066 [Escherichia coli DEC10A]EHW75949.1 hypothetical protein ECDEC10B_1197 [Escherichia coli DEC10B]EHW78812.1 hypothetical protein ECDEC10C_1233 [Escherichia coli DEC10C]EHW82287.1 hypothet
MPGYARHQADEQTQNCLMRYAYQYLQNPNRWTDQAFTLRPAQVFPCLFADRRICSNPH